MISYKYTCRGYICSQEILKKRIKFLHSIRNENKQDWSKYIGAK